MMDVPRWLTYVNKRVIRYVTVRDQEYVNKRVIRVRDRA